MLTLLFLFLTAWLLCDPAGHVRTMNRIDRK